MTLSKKLLLLPVVSTVALILLAAIMVHSIGRVHDSANYANVNTVPSIKVLDKAMDSLATLRVDMWKLFASTNPTVDGELERQIAGANSAMEQAFKDYEPLISDDKDKALLQADRNLEAAYGEVVTHALGLVHAGKRLDAAALMEGNSDKDNAVVKALQEHYQYNETLGREGDAEASRIQSRAVWTGLALTLVMLGVISTFAYFVYRQVMGQVGGEPALVSAVTQRVALGDFTSAIHLRPGDTGSLFSNVAKMQSALREREQADRHRAAQESERMKAELAAAVENTRIRNALDRVSIGVMVADTQGTIVYANDFARNIFRTQAAEIRAQLPQFDPDKIVGHSIDLFHRNPAHQRNMLATLSGNHSMEITLGGVTLRLAANPVIDAAGGRVGTVVQWVDRTQEVQVEQEVQATVAAALEGDMTVRIREEGKNGFFKALADGMNRLLGNFGEVLHTISASAAEVEAGAGEISRGNADLSQRTEEQASSLEETASSMEEITAAVKSSADNAAQASQLAVAARDQALRGGSVVQAAVAAMNDINTSSKKIADIIGVIDAIAFQTNLLALNAAVEAARAGEQGRGFAVVASEVRNLASRSASAAKEIKALIQESVSKVNDGTTLVDDSGKVLEEILVSVKRVTDVVTDIAASSQEQASGIEQVNKAVMSMDEVTQQNAALVEEATAAAQSLNEQATRLTQMMARYRVGREPAGQATAANATRAPDPGSTAKTPTSRTERRSATRPWSKSPAPAAAAPVELPKAAAAGGDDDWKTF